MADHPILMNGEAVRGILAGRKTQTRRIMRPQPAHDPRYVYQPQRLVYKAPSGWEGIMWEPWTLGHARPGYEHVVKQCPYGVPGESRLWVRETFRIDADIALDEWVIVYRADGAQQIRCYEPPLHTRYVPPVLPDRAGRWRPSIHMPRWACRLWRTVTGVRVERIRDITEDDIIAEGVRSVWEDLDAATEYWVSDPALGRSTCPFEAFAELWDSINAKRGYGWDTNCWVWCVDFEEGGDENSSRDPGVHRGGHRGAVGDGAGRALLAHSQAAGRLEGRRL